MLNLQHVRSFVAVIECGNFQDAAKRLACSQPTVSQHILKLETALETRLVVRERPMCRLTPAGLTFLPFARTLLSVASRARDALGSGRLTVGAASNIGIYLLQPHLQAFRNRIECETQIDMWIGSNPRVAEKLVNRELDVAVMEWWDDRPGYTARLWRREALVVIVPPDHPWARLRTVDKNRLFEVALVGGESGSGTGSLLRRVYGEDADRLRVGLQLGSTEAVKHAVRAGLGVSIVLARAVADEVRAGTLHALELSGTAMLKDIYVARPDDEAVHALAPRFVDHLMASTVA